MNADLQNFKELFYSRTSKVVDVDKLSNSKVAVIGCGGLGSFSAEILARTGVGHLVLVDNDKVEVSNLARQNFEINDLNKYKVEALKEKIHKINSDIKITSYPVKFTISNANEILKDVDCVLSAVDSLKAKKEINFACKKLSIPFVHSTAVKQNGEILFVTKNSVCVECLYPNMEESPEKPEDVGVIPPVPTIVGLVASNMIINYLSNRTTYENVLYRFNFKTMDFYKIKLKQRNDCPVCSIKDN